MDHTTRTKAATSQRVRLQVISETTGLPYGNLDHDAAGIALWYCREGAAKTTITLADLATPATAWASGGWVHISDGVHILCLPDAALATGVDRVTVGGTASGAIIVPAEVELQDSPLSGAITESYATDGSAATLGQLLYMIWAMLAELSFTGTTGTAKKLDGSTSAMTFTVDDADDPTSITRSS